MAGIHNLGKECHIRSLAGYHTHPQKHPPPPPYGQHLGCLRTWAFLALGLSHHWSDPAPGLPLRPGGFRCGGEGQEESAGLPEKQGKHLVDPCYRVYFNVFDVVGNAFRVVF